MGQTKPQPTEPITAITQQPKSSLWSRQRILMVCSTGGHLAQLIRLEPWWRDHDRTWVTFDKPDAQNLLADEPVIYAHHPTTRNLPNLARNTRLANDVLRDYQPDMVVSNGAGLALPFFALAKARGIKTVYLEVYDRIDSRTMTGRLCRPFTDLFLVQWAEQQRLYPGSRLIEPLY